MPTYVKPWTFSNSPPNTNVIDADQVNQDLDILYSAANTLDAAVADIVGKTLKGVWRTLEEQAFALDDGTGGTMAFYPDGTARFSGGPVAVHPGGSAFTAGFAGFYFDPADYTVPGLTTQLRVVASGYRNGTGWGGGTATFGLFPNVGVGGALSQFFVNIGSIVSGSGAAIVNPSALGNHPIIGAAFTPPAASHFMLGTTLSSSPAAGAVMMGRIALQLRHV